MEVSWLLAGVDTLTLVPWPWLDPTLHAGFAWASVQVLLKCKSGLSFLKKQNKTHWQFPTAHRVSSRTSMGHSSSPRPGLWLLASWDTFPGFTLYIPVMPNWLHIPKLNISHLHAFDHASSLSWNMIVASTILIGWLPLILWESTLLSSPWGNLPRFLPAGLSVCFYVCPSYSGMTSKSWKTLHSSVAHSTCT